MKYLIFLLAFCGSLIANAEKDDPKYPVSAIPADLKENVNAVIRDYTVAVKIYAKNRVTTSIHLVVTILNPNGKNQAEAVVEYDKLKKVSEFKGTAYDAFGNVIKKLKSSDIHDQSSYDGYSLFSDNRVKWADLTQGSYPYTVDFEYETEQKYLYGLQGITPLAGEKMSLQRASYQLLFKPEVAPRYKAFNIEKGPLHQTQDGMESLTWNFDNMKPVKREPYGPDYIEYVPHISAAPSRFEFDGYEGDMSTWEKYGKWRLTLLAGRDVLSAETKQKVVDLTKNLKTTEEKTRALYEYVQNKTRYVNISEGIGGIQPFEASLVDQVGYGDCKALSNYMVALLHEAGITGYYSPVKAGKYEYDLVLDFPSHQTNHIIVAVPNGKDTLWLECTSQTNPFGYAGMFTGDRKAFIVTPEGGAWVNTPKYPADQNLQTRTAHVYIDKVAGDASAKIKTTYSGLQYENDGVDNAVNQQGEDQKKWAQRSVDIPSFDVVKVTMKNVKTKMPSAIVDLDLNLKRYASISGKRMFINPNLMNRISTIPEKVENRKTKVIRNFGFVDHDTIYYHVPEEFYPEFLPEPVKIKSRFGEYEATYKLQSGELIYTRKFKSVKGAFPPESYTELIEFYKNINKADNTKIVLINKT